MRYILTLISVYDSPEGVSWEEQPTSKATLSDDVRDLVTWSGAVAVYLVQRPRGYVCPDKDYQGPMFRPPAIG